jgi:hypothetical protein
VPRHIAHPDAPNRLGRIAVAARIDAGSRLCGQSMIPKSGYRFSEKIMLHQKARPGFDFIKTDKALASPLPAVCVARRIYN